MKSDAITLKDFQYELPEELIAQKPADRRDASRLMHLNRSTGEVAHLQFPNFIDLVRPGDLLVLNDTRVIPARFFCRRATGGKVEGLFLNIFQQDPQCWEVLLRNAGRCKPGEQLCFEGVDSKTPVMLELVESRGKGQWLVRPIPNIAPEDILSQVGITPLPPYIQRQADKLPPEDQNRYQTVYASKPGAVAAPTAGLHFTDDLLKALADKGVSQTRVTLHVGLGTFAPVKEDDLTKHPMHSEWYELSPQAADDINRTKQAGGRVIAIGTTSVRVMESVARNNDGKIVPETGWTELFIYPPADFYATDAILTNFHLPGSTLLMLISAFVSPRSTAGIDTVIGAYQKAIAEKYRFFSYGDAMFIS